MTDYRIQAAARVSRFLGEAIVSDGITLKTRHHAPLGRRTSVDHRLLIDQ